MKHMIDPTESGRYDNTTVVVTAADANPVLVLKRDPNRVSVALTIVTPANASIAELTAVGVMRGAAFVPLAGAHMNRRSVVLKLDEYGQALQEDLFASAITAGTVYALVDTHLINRGS